MSDRSSPGDPLTTPSSATARTAEHELLATVASGSRSAMARVYFLYVARLANFFVHMGASASLVEELISDTMFDVWWECGTIRSDASVAVWIMGLAYSHGQMRLGRTELAGPPVLPSGPHTAHEIAVTTTSRKRGSLQDLLLALPFEERVVFHLVYSGCHSRQSVADIMNMSAERVDVLLTQSRHRLWYSKEESKRAGSSSRSRTLTFAK